VQAAMQVFARCLEHSVGLSELQVEELRVSQAIQEPAPEPGGDSACGGVPPADTRCPSGHELTPFEAPEPGCRCDACGRVVAGGSWAHGCRGCDYDLCAACRTPPATKVCRALVRADRLCVSGSGCM
jgi:hypothetical protein